MKYPDFFNNIETIKVYDDLSQFLWVNDDWLVELSYLDIVKTAGHSCGTVAWAYLVALEWLKALYKDELPKRWNIKVELRRNPLDDNAWVVWSVLSNVTWATIDFGFGWIPGGKYNRRDLLFFWADIEWDVCLTRLDTNEKVNITYTPWKIVKPMEILKSAIMPGATQEDKDSFPVRFQEMVKTVLGNADKVIDIK